MSLINTALVPYLFKRGLQVHTKCNSYEPKQRQRESPHSQLQVQSHHHITVAKEGRNICKGNPKIDLLPKFANSIQHALKPNGERKELMLELGNPVTKLMKQQYKEAIVLKLLHQYTSKAAGSA